MFDMKKVGERLKEERARLALTQREISNLAGITQTTYSKYELGERTPTLEAVDGFYRLGMDISYLLTGERPSLGTEAPLTTNERVWLQHYRDAKDKIALLKLVAAFNTL